MSQVLNEFLASFERPRHEAPIVHASTGKIEPCRFLQLPRELRDKVYRFILKAPKPINWIEHSCATRRREDIRTYDTILDTRILRANEQIWDKGREILYGENQIQLKTPFSVNVPLEALKNSPRLEIRVEREYRQYQARLQYHEWSGGRSCWIMILPVNRQTGNLFYSNEAHSQDPSHHEPKNN